MDPAFRRDPYPFYRRLREEAPLFHGPFDLAILTRYADCVAMLRHPHASSDARNSDAYEALMAQQAAAGGAAPQGPNSFLFMDPPDHTRLRGLVSKAFTPRVVEGLRPRIQQLVDALITAAIERGTMELIEDLAYPLPVTVISEMLGVPHEDQETFKGWSRELASSLDPSINVAPEVMQRRLEAQEAFTEYVRALIARRRADPREDLLSALIVAEEQGDRLTEDELISTCILLLIAGHETTVNLIGNGTLALLRHPDQAARLRAEPALIASAVEETLRYDPPVQLTGRTALEDITLSSGIVRKGQQAMLLLGAANRDPAQFPEPETLNIARAENRHIAFGMGIHFCVGAPLARVEGQIALSAIFTRLPDLQLSSEEPEYKQNLTLRGLQSLPLTFTPA
ncbi:MAG: cytochrome P450 [Chloroflexota bacterium]|nr:cytochrome P450 [Chloroflexota bacterium]